MNRFHTTLIALAVFALFVAGCAAIPVEDGGDADIETAVQATLTAVAIVAADDGSAVETESDLSTPQPAVDEADAPAGTPQPSQPADAPQVVLPPQVTDFNPVPRPAASKGDPEAPVVMYEWSDYT